MCGRGFPRPRVAASEEFLPRGERHVPSDFTAAFFARNLGLLCFERSLPIGPHGASLPPTPPSSASDGFCCRRPTNAPTQEDVLRFHPPCRVPTARPTECITPPSDAPLSPILPPEANTLLD
uniref:Uncharacterized protein n=1 Tax=Mycena chlorophos TaxID=658473 RepID=A0ABQ0M7E8_MYCCL|nr:predicted protein [Mycena chlorophos]